MQIQRLCRFAVCVGRRLRPLGGKNPCVVCAEMFVIRLLHEEVLPRAFRSYSPSLVGSDFPTTFPVDEVVEVLFSCTHRL